MLNFPLIVLKAVNHFWNLLPTPFFCAVRYSVFCILPPQSPSHHSNLTSHEYPHWLNSHSVGGPWFVLTAGWSLLMINWIFLPPGPVFVQIQGSLRLLHRWWICWECQRCLFPKPFLPPPLFLSSVATEQKCPVVILPFLLFPHFLSCFFPLPAPLRNSSCKLHVSQIPQLPKISWSVAP